jgi:hypothetical protein
MILMRANPLLRPLEGVGPEILTLWGSLVAISGPKKDSISGPIPSNGPRNGYCPHQNLNVPRHLNNRYPSVHSGQFGDQKSLDLHEKSLDLSNYEIFPNKILKSRTFKKSSILIVKMSEPVPVPVARLNVKAGVALEPLEVAQDVFLERLNK